MVMRTREGMQEEGRKGVSLLRHKRFTRRTRGRRAGGETSCKEDDEEAKSPVRGKGGSASCVDTIAPLGASSIR